MACSACKGSDHRRNSSKCPYYKNRTNNSTRPPAKRTRAMTASEKDRPDSGVSIGEEIRQLAKKQMVEFRSKKKNVLSKTDLEILEFARKQMKELLQKKK